MTTTGMTTIGTTTTGTTTTGTTTTGTTTIGTTTTETNYYKLADLIDELRKLKDTINPQDPYNDFDKDIVLLAQADCRYSSINYLWNVHGLGTNLVTDDAHGRDIVNYSYETLWPESRTWRISKLGENCWVVVPKERGV